MPDQRLLALTRKARDRTEEIRVRGDAYKDEHARRMMLDIAESYMKLAERLG